MTESVKVRWDYPTFKVLCEAAGKNPNRFKKTVLCLAECLGIEFEGVLKRK